QDSAAQAESQPAQAGPTGVAATLQSMNPDISFVADVALAWFGSEDNLQSGGHDPARTGFTLQQLEMAIGSAVDPYFRVDGNIVFSQFGVEIEEVYATTLSLPWSLQARVGQFLTRFGRINATHPHQWDFVDQAFAIGRYFGAEGNRGLGAELSYLTPLPWYVEIVGSITEAGGDATARSFFGAAPLTVESPLDFQSTLAIEQFFAFGPDWSLLWGVSAATGPNGTGHDNRSDVYGVDVYLKYRPVTRQSDTVVALQAEWFHRRRQVPRDLLADHGGYAYLFWRFDRQWGTALRYELGLPAENRAGDTGDDYLDPEWTEPRQRVSASLTYWPTEFSRIRAQGSRDAPGWRDDPIYALMLALEFTIGVHGAHAF
ncbi:MAG TPA: zinc-regulated TonB-dependent outer membrane receptor, partial [Haliangium sp.]|nr:zinc-regulated TonB-dependent outer membrane receptor [Haliangium sp.]